MLLKIIPNKIKVWLIKHLYADIASMGDGGDTALAHVNTTEIALLKSYGGAGTINPRTGLVEFKGKGGGGGGGPQETKSYSSDLPEYAQPFYEEVMKQAGKEIYNIDSTGKVTGVKGAPVYGGDRLEGFNVDQTNVQAGIRGMDARPEFEEAITSTDTLMGYGTDAARTGLTGAGAYTPGSLATLGRTTPGTFDADAAATYMSPYGTNVTDMAKAEARRDADIAKSGSAMGSIKRGTFGGGREALIAGEANRNLQTQLAKIGYQGDKDAYENAQKQFERDRAAGMSAEESTLKAELDRRARGQQGEQFGVGLQKDLGLAGLQYGLAGAGQQADIATADQQAQLELLQAQAAAGAEQQAMGQEEKNIAYQRFMEEQNAVKRNLEFQNNILRGTAGALGSTQTQYTPAPSLASQITGMGVAGLGLYNALK
jgi:hypothetical protein